MTPGNRRWRCALLGGVVFVAVLVAAFGAPAAARAEVMDKVPPLSVLCAPSALVCALTVALGSIRWYLAALTLPLTLAIFAWLGDFVFDPFVGPCIWHEDSAYALVAWFGTASMIVAYPVGMAVGARRGALARRHPDPQSP